MLVAILRYNYLTVESTDALSQCQVVGPLPHLAAFFGLPRFDGINPAFRLKKTSITLRV